MENITISNEAQDFVLKQSKEKQGIAIYRDVKTIGCCITKEWKFFPTVNAVDEKKINDQFTRFGTKGRISIWIEKALLKQLEEKDVSIELTGKFLKKLKVHFRNAQITS